MTVPSAEWEAGEFCVLPCTADTVTVFFHHGSGELMVRVWHQNAVIEAEEELLAACA